MSVAFESGLFPREVGWTTLIRVLAEGGDELASLLPDDLAALLLFSLNTL